MFNSIRLRLRNAKRNRYHDLIVKGYLEAGKRFGEIVSYIFMGECVGFKSIFRKWEKYEKAYSVLGYRTISLDDFISAGGYDKDINYLLKVNRNITEKPVLHAKIYRENFFDHSAAKIVV